MAHRANIYAVRVRKRRDISDESYQRLGNFTGDGLSLVSALDQIAPGLSVVGGDGTTRVNCIQCDLDGDTLFMVFHHGQSGQAADILDQADNLKFHQEPEHTHSVNRACLFVLPPDQTSGWLSVHVDAGRSVKGLLVKGLTDEFANRFPDFIVEVNPVVSAGALKAAANQDRIEQVELIKWVRPADLADASVDKWTKRGHATKIRVDITSAMEAQGRRGVKRIRDRIEPDLLARFLRGDAAVLNTILEFRGLPFDEARFVVTMPNGVSRTFRLNRPEGGHPISEDLEDLHYEHGDPTPASLRRALRGALNDVML